MKYLRVGFFLVNIEAIEFFPNCSKLLMATEQHYLSLSVLCKPWLLTLIFRGRPSAALEAQHIIRLLTFWQEQRLLINEVCNFL